MCRKKLQRIHDLAYATKTCKYVVSLKSEKINFLLLVVVVVIMIIMIRKGLLNRQHKLYLKK